MICNKNPTEFGYNTRTWNGPVLKDYILKNFGISYSRAHIYNILKALGFTYQKGKPKIS